MYAHEEAAFEAKAEKMLAGHRLPPNGRNVFAWNMRNLNNIGYRGKFDDTFKGTPGSKEWLDKQFCPKCDKRHSHCECSKGENKDVDLSKRKCKPYLSGVV